MAKFVVDMRISYMLYEALEQKKTGDLPFRQIKPSNKTFTLTLDATSEEEAKHEIEILCSLLVNKSNQEKIRQGSKI